MDELYTVAKIIGVFGLGGFLKIHRYTESAERLRTLRAVFVGRSIQSLQTDTVEEVIIRDRALLIKLQSIKDRTEAEKIVGSFLFIGKENVATPSKGSYFVHDIIGCEVWSDEGRKVGTVEEVYPLATQDIWGIRCGTKLNLLPAVKEFVKKVDVANRIVVVHLIEGLLEE